LAEGLGKIKVSRIADRCLTEMLYRYTGLKNREIRELIELDYNTVSVGRKKLFNNSKLGDLIRRIEERCQEYLTTIFS
jgi:hypothetical protein